MTNANQRAGAASASSTRVSQGPPWSFSATSAHRSSPGWSVSVAQLQEMLARAAFAPTTDSGGIHGLGARA